jgi:hypothetical protein
VLVFTGLLLGLTAGCNEDTDGAEVSHDEPLPQTIAPQPRDAGVAVAATDAAVDKTKLWCAVKAISDSQCVFCHDGEGTAGSPMGLLTHADYLKVAPLTGPKKVYEAVAARVHDRAKPMPPRGLLPAASLKTIDDWVDAGAPPGPDGGCPLPDAGPKPVTK